MAISPSAIQYALTLLRQGRLRLGELCEVMALYGERNQGDEASSGDGLDAEMLEAIVGEVLRGGHSVELEDLANGDAVPVHVDEEWHALEDVTGHQTDVDGLQEDSTDLGAQRPEMDRRIISSVSGDDVASRVRRAATQTDLARFYADNDIEPTVSPGLDADGPALDGEGLDNYALGEPIGKGGAGQVLHGVDRNLRRSVAVKVLHEKHRSNPLLLRAFIEEAIITGGLEHPNIVPVYELGYSNELGPYYVMKRLDGITLGAALQGLRKHDPEMEARFDLDRLLTIFIELCQAIVYAHDRRVVHCDLKPNNVLIGHYGEVLLVDWGLAYVMGDVGTLQARSQFWSGTPGFMSPEQVIGDVTKYDGRTDVWALGGLLYAMLCLARPFVGKSKQETLHQVLNEDLIPPSKRNPTRRVPEALEAIVLKAMSKLAEDRYPTVNALMADVENHLAGRRRLRQRVELGQRALTQVRGMLDEVYSTEAVIDALQEKIIASGPEKSKPTQWRRDLQELREPLVMQYREAVQVGVEAVEAGAHHPALNTLLGEVYWRVFKRLYPARVPANRQIQRLATDLLRQIGDVVLSAVVTAGRRLAGLGDSVGALPSGADSNSEDPWLDAVLAYCGPDASAPDADRDGVSAQLGRRLSFLKDVTLFQSVPGMELLPIAAACERRTFRAKTPIFNGGDFGDSLYIIVEGLVNIVRGGVVINTIGPASCLGEIAIIDGATRTAGAVCATDVVVYRLSAEGFRRIVRENGTIGLAVMQVLTGRLREATAREEALRR